MQYCMTMYIFEWHRAVQSASYTFYKYLVIKAFDKCAYIVVAMAATQTWHLQAHVCTWCDGVQATISSIIMH